jgi:glutaredoxin
VLATLGLLLGSVGLLVSGEVAAQTVYRSVGPDGRTTYSDQPPASADLVTVTGLGGKAPGGGAALPYELNLIASKYPVTLYTANHCAPCDLGRALLTRRGIPFNEKTVNTADGADALQGLSGDNTLPLLSIGSQQVKGFSEGQWTQALDAVAYPNVSRLPANYRNPTATPLVGLQKGAANAPVEERPAPRQPRLPSRPSPSSPGNPAGITF